MASWITCSHFRSGKHIHGLYQEYEGYIAQEEEKMEDDEEEEEDYSKDIAISSSEGLGEGSWSLGKTPTSPQPTDLLMYGISPGFKSVVWWEEALMVIGYFYLAWCSLW